MDVATADAGIGPDGTKLQQPDELARDKISNGNFHVLQLSTDCAAGAEASERGRLIFEAAKFAKQFWQGPGMKAGPKQTGDGFSVATDGHGQQSGPAV